MELEKILIVDDDEDIQSLLLYNLKNAGYNVTVASSGKEALTLLEQTYSLLILDVMMPKMSGYSLCQKIRTMDTANKNVPIIFLTAKDSEFDELLGFDMGADDYLVKPISMNKLIARVNANIKKNRHHHRSEDAISLGNLKINKNSRTVKIDSNLINLTKTEFDLLFTLISKENMVLKREELLQAIQDESIIVTDRVIDVHIKKLRDKLLQYHTIIETVHGVGYVCRKDNIPENS